MATITISDKLYKNIVSYTELNCLDLGVFIESCLNDGFNREKYGIPKDMKQEVIKDTKPKYKKETKNDFSEEYLC